MRHLAMLCAALLCEALLCAAGACSPARDETSATLRDVVQLGRVEAGALSELSGVVRSTATPALFWSFNDSGHDATLFAMDSSGRARGRVHVAGASNVDWEAMAAGPCDEGACVYIGDVGDNDADRQRVKIWRVREPEAGDDNTANAVALEFTYADGPHDVEAMWVSPDTAIWIVTKRPLRDGARRFRSALLFRLPASAWRSPTLATAELIDSLPITPRKGNSDGWVTDAAFFRDEGADSARHRARVAIRTYQSVVILAADPWTGRPGVTEARCSLEPLHEREGEAIAWLRGGRLLLGNEGRHSRLASGRCQP